MTASDRTPAPLAIGDEAWCIFIERHPESRAKGKGKGTVLGAGRMRVVAVDGAMVRGVVLITSDRESSIVGREREFKRNELYSVKDPTEHLAFGDALSAYWDRGLKGDAARARLFGEAATCDHPEHRRGTRGGLRAHQEVCMQCGAVVLKRRGRP